MRCYVHKIIIFIANNVKCYQNTKDYPNTMISIKGYVILLLALWLANYHCLK